MTGIGYDVHRFSQNRPLVLGGVTIPHTHGLAANGLFTPDGRFHPAAAGPAEDLAPAIELFRHRFLHALREAKLISPQKLADLLSWKHSGFHIHDGGEKPVAAHDSAGRKRLAEP
jgi:hypothetical protein